jgi:hemerythrin-like domain-containing protein
MLVPVDVLITEHKLILQAVTLIKKEVNQLQTNKSVNPNFITIAVDFFRTYADRFHHGKEEGILFKELSQKKLNKVDFKVMNELISEHVFARKTVTSLENAKNTFISGKKEAQEDILKLLATLAELYPSHIEKEDEHFFYPSMRYFSEREQKDMLVNFIGFNQDFTDKRYKQIINSLE